MNHLSQCLLLAAVLFLGFVPTHSKDQSKVFMYVTEGSRDLELMLTQEVTVMRQMLEEAGYAVEIATTGDQVMTSESFTLTPTISLQEIDIEDYSGVILPCMAPAPGTSSTPIEVAALLKTAIAQNKPIAASRGSVVALAKAGGLVNRKYGFAGPVNTLERTEFAGGEFLGLGVVRDGNISTAGICPLAAKALGEADGTIELTQNFIASLAKAN